MINIRIKILPIIISVIATITSIIFIETTKALEISKLSNFVLLIFNFLLFSGQIYFVYYKIRYSFILNFYIYKNIFIYAIILNLLPYLGIISYLFVYKSESFSFVGITLSYEAVNLTLTILFIILFATSALNLFYAVFENPNLDLKEYILNKKKLFALVNDARLKINSKDFVANSKTKEYTGDIFLCLQKMKSNLDNEYSKIENNRELLIINKIRNSILLQLISFIDNIHKREYIQDFIAFLNEKLDQDDETDKAVQAYAELKQLR